MLLGVAYSEIESVLSVPYDALPCFKYLQYINNLFKLIDSVAREMFANAILCFVSQKAVS